MTLYLALLRGINVGGNNKISMLALKQAFTAYGFKNTTTYINSGNVLFQAENQDIPNLTKDVENLIEKKFGFQIAVLVKTFDELKKIADFIPSDWVNDLNYRSDVMFLWPKADSVNVLEKIAINPQTDKVLYCPGAVLWQVLKKDYTKSKMNDIIKNPLYKQMTVRNVNTVRKIRILGQTIDEALNNF